MSFTDVIAQGCFTWNIPLPEGALEGREEYTRLLLEKNQVMKDVYKRQASSWGARCSAIGCAAAYGRPIAFRRASLPRAMISSSWPGPGA